MKKQLPALTEQVTNNWFYKLIAFFVALAIWTTTLQGRKDAMLWRNMDLELIMKPDFVVTNLIDRNVRVKVSGPKAVLKKFRQSPQTVTINLTGEESGKKTLEITPEDIHLPPGLKLIAVEPSHLDIELKEVKKP